MRVAVVTTSYPREPGDPSGHFVRARAAHAARRGAEVVVFAPGARATTQEDGLVRVGLGARELFGWPGAWARFRERPARILEAAPMALRLRAELAKRGPFDRVEAHWIVPTGWPLCHAIEGALEVFAHGADVRALRAMPRPLSTWVVRALLDRGATFVFAAESLREDLMACLDSDLERALCARSRVEAPMIEVPERTSLSDPREDGACVPGGPYVVWVGRLVPEKRPHLAIEAAALAGVPLVLIGDGPAAPKPSDRVFALGRVPREDSLRWIANAGALLSTSLSEGAPTAVREARALGVPVVATPAGDLERWARDDPGIQLGDDIDALAAALRAALFCQIGGVGFRA